MSPEAETTRPGGPPSLPGGVGLSRLRVYDWPAAPGSDGFCGGSPHMHLACAEAYAVTGGSGAVQTLTTDGFATHPLGEGDLLWFTPGTVHRLVNDGDLRLVVIMQNAGLPEAGDAVLTFPPDVLADPTAYARAVTLDPADPEGSARKRRELAVSGFTGLRERLDAGDVSAMTDFHAAALRLVSAGLPAWRTRFEQGPAADAARTAARLEALEAGDTSHLTSAEVLRSEPAPTWGMCGHLEKFETTEPAAKPE